MKANKEAAGESYYIDVLSKAEEIFGKSGVEHRFVGGAIANPVTLNTIVDVNPLLHTADFDCYAPLSLVRSDDSIRDIDAKGFPYPPVSIEPTSYPGWPKRNKLLQFVSTLDVDDGGNLSLNFGEVTQVTP